MVFKVPFKLSHSMILWHEVEPLQLLKITTKPMTDFGWVCQGYGRGRITIPRVSLLAFPQTLQTGWRWALGISQCRSCCQGTQRVLILQNNLSSAQSYIQAHSSWKLPFCFLAAFHFRLSHCCFLSAFFFLPLYIRLDFEWQWNMLQ